MTIADRKSQIGVRAVTWLLLLTIVQLPAPISGAARAATLTGTFVDRAGDPYHGVVRFRPKPNATVLLADGSLGVGGDYDFTTTTNGLLSATVVAGIYYVFPGVTAQFTVDVPDDTNTYTLASRITNSLATYQTGIGAAIAVPLASETVSGKVKTTTTEADPIVYTAAEVDDLLAGIGGSISIRVPTFPARANEIIFPTSPYGFQQSNNVAVVPVTANAAGPTGTTVQVRFNGGSWATLGTTDQYGIASGTITCASGQGSLDIRVSGDTNVVSAALITVGDIIHIWGQSNGSGRLASNQSQTNSSVTFLQFGNDYTWQALTDPTDSDDGQLDTVSSDTDAGGSIWPKFADEVYASTGRPVMIVQSTKGATGFNGGATNSWEAWSSTHDRATLFGSATYRLSQTGGKVIYWIQGEGGIDDTTGASYNTPFSAMASAEAALFPSIKIVPTKLHETTGIAANKQTNLWYAIGRLWSTNANVLRGVTLADTAIGTSGNIVGEDDGGGSPYYHIVTTTNGAAVAHRFATNFIAHFP